MKRFIFSAEGLGKELSAVAKSEKSARAIVWDRLSNDEQNQVEIIECIDEIPYGIYSVVLEVHADDVTKVADIALMVNVPYEQAALYKAECADSLRYQLKTHAAWKVLDHVSVIYPFPVIGSIKLTSPPEKESKCAA